MSSEAIAALVGAGVGAVIGALIVIIPQYVGKLRITFSRIKISPMLHIIDSEGIDKSTICALNEAQYADLWFVADIHNSKAYPLSYRDVALEFVCKDIRQTLMVKERQRSGTVIPVYVLNQPSKTMVQYLFECKIRGEEFEILKENDGKANFFLRLENHRGHKKRLSIPEIEIAKPQ